MTFCFVSIQLPSKARPMVLTSPTDKVFVEKVEKFLRFQTAFESQMAVRDIISGPIFPGGWPSDVDGTSTDLGTPTGRGPLLIRKYTQGKTNVGIATYLSASHESASSSLVSADMDPLLYQSALNLNHFAFTCVASLHTNAVRAILTAIIGSYNVTGSLPFFLAQGCVPLSPAFVAIPERSTFRIGKEQLKSKEPLGPRGAQTFRHGIACAAASSVDLLDVLDRLLTDSVMRTTAEPLYPASPAPATSPNDVALGLRPGAKPENPALEDAEQKRLTVLDRFQFTAIFSPGGCLLRASGGFFALPHAHRLVVAGIAAIVGGSCGLPKIDVNKTSDSDTDQAFWKDLLSEHTSHSGVDPVFGATYKTGTQSQPFSGATDLFERIFCSAPSSSRLGGGGAAHTIIWNNSALLCFRLSENGAVYLASVKEKEPATSVPVSSVMADLSQTLVKHCNPPLTPLNVTALRHWIDLRSDDATDSAAGCFGCIPASSPAFVDICQVAHTTPGLINEHLSRIAAGERCSEAFGHLPKSGGGGTEPGFDGHRQNRMGLGLRHCSVAMHVCPSLREAAGKDGKGMGILDLTDSGKGPLDRVVKDIEEWVTNPVPKHAFFIGNNGGVFTFAESEISQEPTRLSQLDKDGNFRPSPINSKGTHRTSPMYRHALSLLLRPASTTLAPVKNIDLSNNAVAPPSEAVVTEAPETVAITVDYLPTAVVLPEKNTVDTEEDPSSDDETAPDCLTRRARLRMHQAVSQSLLDWGHCTVTSAVARAWSVGGCDAAEAVEVSRSWAAELAWREGAILSAAVTCCEEAARMCNMKKQT